jgi:hypothetical protein
MNLTIKEYIQQVEENKLNPTDVVNFYLNKAKKENDKYFSFIRFHESYIKDNLDNFKTKKLK